MRKIEEALEEEEEAHSEKLQQYANLKEKRDQLKDFDSKILERLYDSEQTNEACDIIGKVNYKIICLKEALGFTRKSAITGIKSMQISDEVKRHFKYSSSLSEAAQDQLTDDLLSQL